MELSVLSPCISVNDPMINRFLIFVRMKCFGWVSCYSFVPAFSGTISNVLCNIFHKNY
jgi:hypothetical protein